MEEISDGAALILRENRSRAGFRVVSRKYGNMPDDTAEMKVIEKAGPPLRCGRDDRLIPRILETAY
jgi:hypothetical protein